MIGFEKLLNRWLEEHCARSTGERKRKLREGLGHAENEFLQKIWWPAFGSFEDLHPEYEVYDMAGKSRFIDFAYMPGHLQVALEMEGYGPHLRNVSRWQFSDDHRRYNQLIIDGWLPLRFSYDDITDHPRLCEQSIRTLLGRWMGAKTSEFSLTIRERQILQWAVRRGVEFSPGQLAEELAMSLRHIRTLLHSLSRKGFLQPASGRERIRLYRLNREHPIVF
jgi:uncharacterized protein YneF (UPF0154 family)